MIIQSMWIGDRLSDLERMAIQSHLSHGHEFHLYTYGPLANVPNGTVFRDGNEILPGSDIFSYQTTLGKGSFSAFSNYFRYQLLLMRGGWWVDTDVVCLSPHYPFPLNQWPILATERQKNKPEPHIASCVIYCPADHPLMHYCCEKANRKDRNKIVWGEVGPALLSAAQKVSGSTIILQPQAFCPINWYNFEDLFQEGHGEEILESFGLHLWNEMWRRNNFDKCSDYVKGSIYQNLRDIGWHKS